MDYSKYENKLFVPTRQEYIIDREAHFDDNYTGTLNQLVAAKKIFMEEANSLFRDAESVYRAETFRLHKVVFKEDLRVENGHSNAIGDIVFEKAWDEGHSDGLTEVALRYDSLTSFMDSIIDKI